jgi:WD40 repeat protein
LGEHNGQGLCLCAVDEEGHLEMDDDDENIIHPECPVIGHRKDVTRVVFSPDGAQVVSASRDQSVRQTLNP